MQRTMITMALITSLVSAMSVEDTMTDSAKRLMRLIVNATEAERDAAITAVYSRYFLDEDEKAGMTTNISYMCAEMLNSKWILVNGTQYTVTYDTPEHPIVLKIYDVARETVNTSKYDDVINGENVAPTEESILFAERFNNMSREECLANALTVYDFGNDDILANLGFFREPSLKSEKRESLCEIDGQSDNKKEL